MAARRKDVPTGRSVPSPQDKHAFPLEMGEPEMRHLLAVAGDHVVRHVSGLSEQPTHSTRGGNKAARARKEPLPELGAPAEELVRTLFQEVIPRSLNTASPGYLAYVPGGGLFASAVADMIALATNRYTGIWIAAPALVQIEKTVISWLCEMVGLPPTAGGLLTSGGSMATLIALVAARSERLGEELSKGVVYTSTQAHHSVHKAALFAGIMPRQVRSLPVDERFRLRTDMLAQALEEDSRAGRKPFLVVASAGTTNTGAIDDLPAIRQIAASHGCWLHIDAAYGGFFALTERGRQALLGLSEADSITLDPHKGLFLPYGTGSLLVRDPGALRRACRVEASYMPKSAADEDHVDLADLGPELSREARGLRVWLPLKLHGAHVFRQALDEKLDLARKAAKAISAMSGVEMISEPELSLFAFRFRPPHGPADEGALERLNRALLHHINQRKRVFLSGTSAGGRFFLRVCVLSFRTHQDRIETLIEDVRAGIEAAGDLVMARRGSPGADSGT